MPDDKRIISTQILEDTADAIREKLGTQAGITPAEFANNISQIESGNIDVYRIAQSSISGFTYSQIGSGSSTINSTKYTLVNPKKIEIKKAFIANGLGITELEDGTYYGYIAGNPYVIVGNNFKNISFDIITENNKKYLRVNWFTNRANSGPFTIINYNGGDYASKYYFELDTKSILFSSSSPTNGIILADSFTSTTVYASGDYSWSPDVTFPKPYIKPTLPTFYSEGYCKIIDDYSSGSQVKIPVLVLI